MVSWYLNLCVCLISSLDILMSSIEEPIPIRFTNEEAVAWADGARHLLNSLKVDGRVSFRFNGNVVMMRGIVNQEEKDHYLARKNANFYALDFFSPSSNGGLDEGYVFGIAFATRDYADGYLDQILVLYSCRLIIAQRAVRAWVRRGRALALAMGMHPRLGSDGLLAMLDVDVLRCVLSHC